MLPDASNRFFHQNKLRRRARRRVAQLIRQTTCYIPSALLHRILPSKAQSILNTSIQALRSNFCYRCTRLERACSFCLPWWSGLAPVLWPTLVEYISPCLPCNLSPSISLSYQYLQHCEYFSSVLIILTSDQSFAQCYTIHRVSILSATDTIQHRRIQLSWVHWTTSFRCSLPSRSHHYQHLPAPCGTRTQSGIWKVRPSPFFCCVHIAYT